MRENERMKLTGFLGNEDGIMAVVVAMLLPVFIVIAALAIDLGYSYWKRNTVQVDASASALAGAGRLMDDGIYDPVNEIVIFATIDPDGDGVPNDPDGAVIFSEALLYAEKNIPNEDILAAVDLHAGNWNPILRIFTSAGTWDPDTLLFMPNPAEYDSNTGIWTAVAGPVIPLDAVMSTTRRADDGPNDNALPLFLAAAVGMPDININTSAIATVGAQIPIGFSGCLMALNPDEPDTLTAFGTADISAFDCDIYINSTDECALSGNGVPTIEVGDPDNPGMIYVVGDYCATNDGVEYNCNLSSAEIEAGMTCPEIDAQVQMDPFAYTYSEAYMATSGMAELRDLECGKQYTSEETPFTNGLNLWEAYGLTFEEADAKNQTGLGNFKIAGQTFTEFCVDIWGNPDYTKDVLCENTIVPVTDSGNVIVNGGEVMTNTGDWTWSETELRWEFNMVPGAYCGGIEARGDGTVVFADGDYILKGKEAVDPPITGGPNPNEFDLRASVAIEGFNVAFYLADEYIEINWGGEADVALVGRQSDTDPLNGFLFYADLSNEGPHQFRGTPAGGYQGIMYFPEGDIVFKGTADSSLAQQDGTDLCTILISDTIYFNGTTAFNASADGCGAGGFEIPPIGAELEVGLVD